MKKYIGVNIGIFFLDEYKHYYNSKSYLSIFNLKEEIVWYQTDKKYWKLVELC